MALLCPPHLKSGGSLSFRARSGYTVPFRGQDRRGCGRMEAQTAAGDWQERPTTAGAQEVT